MKQWLRALVHRTPLWQVHVRRSARRFENAYRLRRDTYRRRLQEKGLRYDEEATVADVRRRLSDRGWTPTTRKTGEVHTFAIVPEYGWHVVFVIEEAPAENRPFEEVVDELSSSVLPEERKIRAQAFLETLYKEGKVFIYDLPADGAEETP